MVSDTKVNVLVPHGRPGHGLHQNSQKKDPTNQTH